MPLPVKENGFLFGGRTVLEFEADIRAEDRLAFLGDGSGNRTGYGIDPGNGRRAKRYAGKKNIKAGQTATHFAQRQPQGQSQIPAPKRGSVNRGRHATAAFFEPASSLSFRISPERTRT